MSSGSTSSFTISGLTNDQEYEVELRAANSVGAAAASDIKQVTPAGSSWTITDLTNAVAIYDIAVLSSLFQERTGGGTTPAGVGDAVGTIRDLTGGGLHLVATSDAARATLQQSGDRYYLVFDGTDDGYTASGFSPGNNVAIGGAWRRRSTYTSYAAIFGIVGGSYATSDTVVLARHDSSNNSHVYVNGSQRLGMATAVDTDYVEDVTKVGTTVSRLRNSEAEQNYTSANNAIAGAFSVGGGGNNMYWYGAHVATTYEADERDLARAHWAARSAVTF